MAAACQLLVMAVLVAIAFYQLSDAKGLTMKYMAMQVLPMEYIIWNSTVLYNDSACEDGSEEQPFSVCSTSCGAPKLIDCDLGPESGSSNQQFYTLHKYGLTVFDFVFTVNMFKLKAVELYYVCVHTFMYTGNPKLMVYLYYDGYYLTKDLDCHGENNVSNRIVLPDNSKNIKKGIHLLLNIEVQSNMTLYLSEVQFFKKVPNDEERDCLMEYSAQAPTVTSSCALLPATRKTSTLLTNLSTAYPSREASTQSSVMNTRTSTLLDPPPTTHIHHTSVLLASLSPAYHNQEMLTLSSVPKNPTVFSTLPDPPLTTRARKTSALLTSLSSVYQTSHGPAPTPIPESTGGGGGQGSVIAGAMAGTLAGVLVILIAVAIVCLTVTVCVYNQRRRKCTEEATKLQERNGGLDNPAYTTTALTTSQGIKINDSFANPTYSSTAVRYIAPELRQHSTPSDPRKASDRDETMKVSLPTSTFDSTLNQPQDYEEFVPTSAVTNQTSPTVDKDPQQCAIASSSPPNHPPDYEDVETIDSTLNRPQEYEEAVLASVTNQPPPTTDKDPPKYAVLEGPTPIASSSPLNQPPDYEDVDTIDPSPYSIPVPTVSDQQPPVTRVENSYELAPQALDYEIPQPARNISPPPSSFIVMGEGQREMGGNVYSLS